MRGRDQLLGSRALGTFEPRRERVGAAERTARSLEVAPAVFQFAFPHGRGPAGGRHAYPPREMSVGWRESGGGARRALRYLRVLFKPDPSQAGSAWPRRPVPANPPAASRRSALL